MEHVPGSYIYDECASKSSKSNTYVTGHNESSLSALAYPIYSTFTSIFSDKSVLSTSKYTISWLGICLVTPSFPSSINCSQSNVNTSSTSHVPPIPIVGDAVGDAVSDVGEAVSAVGANVDSVGSEVVGVVPHDLSRNNDDYI